MEDQYEPKGAAVVDKRVRRVADPLYYGKWISYRVLKAAGDRVMLDVLRPPGKQQSGPVTVPFWVAADSVEEVGETFPYEVK